MESNSQANCKRALLVELSRAPFHLLKPYRKPDGKKPILTLVRSRTDMD